MKTTGKLPWVVDGINSRSVICPNCRAAINASCRLLDEYGAPTNMKASGPHRDRVRAAQRRALNRSIPEAEFMQNIIDQATLRGWLVFHAYDSRRSRRGFPDLCLVRGDVALFLECKTEDGRTTKEQEQWIERLGHVKRVRAGFFRPTDLNEISMILE